MVISKKHIKKLLILISIINFYLFMLKGINYNTKKNSLVYKFNFLYILKFKL